MKKLAMGVAALLSGLFLLALPVIFIFGLTWVSVIVSPWLAPAFLWTLTISIFILGPLAVIRRTRGYSAAGLMVASYVFGACLWITSLLLTYELWGTIAVVIGLVVVGIGIVPVALLAALFHAQWWHLLDLVVLIVATFGTRLLAGWLAIRAAVDRSAQVESQPSDRSRASQQNWIIPLSILGTLALLMSISGRWPHSNESLSATQVFSRASGSVVRIEIDRQDGSEMTGSGFVAELERHPYIVTNKHVVENASRLKVGIQEDLWFDVPNYWLAKDKDLAFLDVPAELQLKALPLRKTPVQPGEIIYAIGFPMGLAKSITQGLVTATYVDTLQFDAPISSGNSGGPVLDAHAEVIGVAALGSKGNTEGILQNLNFAVPVTDFPPLASFQPPSHETVPPLATPAPFSAETPSSSSVQAPSVGPTAEPIVKRAQLVNPGSPPARALPTATAAFRTENGVQVRRALPVESGTQAPGPASAPQGGPVNQTAQQLPQVPNQTSSQPTSRDLIEADRLLTQTYTDLRQSLSPKDRELLKVQELKWLKERNKARNNLTEYLRITEERTQELNHLLTRGEN